LRFAKECGALEDLKQLFKKWDAIMALAPPNERQSMAHMAIIEIHRLLDIHADKHHGLTINGQVIIPAAGEEVPETVPYDVRADSEGGKNT